MLVISLSMLIQIWIYLLYLSTHSTQLPMQSVPIITDVVSSNPAHGEVYSMQHYVIKFVSDLQQVGGFLQVLLFPPPIKLAAPLITEILLKVALRTIKPTDQLKQSNKTNLILFSCKVRYLISIRLKLYRNEGGM